MLNVLKTYDSWTSERLARHALYWLAWLIFYTTTNGSYSSVYLPWLYTELTVMPVKLLLTYFAAYYLLPRYLENRRYWEGIAIMVGLAVIGGLIIRFLEHQIINPFYFGNVPQGKYYYGLKIFYKFLDLIYIASMVMIIKLVQRYVRQEQRNKELMEGKLGAELQILKNQLQPHFLFNTLNNLYGMVLTKDDHAGDVVLRLSDIMSYMLYECNEDFIALDKEIEHIKNYIELEKVRYGDRLELSFEIAGPTGQHQIPPLLFIPFVENAFKHGAANEEKTSWIRINLVATADHISFKIENPAADIHQEQPTGVKSGIGMQNVRKRLELLYPNQYELQITAQDTYLVHLQLQTP